MKFAKQYAVIIVTCFALGLAMYQVEWYIEEQEYQRALAEAEEAEQDYQRKLVDAKQVTITGIERGPAVGGSMAAWFDIYVNVTNFGTNDAVELAVSTSSGETKPSDAEPIELLKAGETATVTLHGEAVWLSRTEHVTLWFNDVKIDREQIDY